MSVQNLHTHSIYCDGSDTPEEIVITAIDKGFDSIGFSGHSFVPQSPVFAQKGDRTEQYRKDVLHLREKYKDKIKIYLGLEVEMLAGADMTGYDYLIGSVHFLKTEDEYIGIDRSEEEVERIINTYFGGNGLKYAKAYYEMLSQLPLYGDFDIIGHFDLVAKHSENRTFFDTTSKEYINAAIEAAEALRGKIPFFEVNTGAIARGYRKNPYPSLSLIKELKRLGFGVVITSDCHNKSMLDCHFDEAAKLLKSCGYREKHVLTDSGFKPVSL